MEDLIINPKILALFQEYSQAGKDQDYSDLPLDELRAVNDPAKYGWGSVLRNTVDYHNGRIYIPKLPNPEQRYDCGAGAERLQEDLTARGIEAKVVAGVDSAQLFYNHVWVELADGRQLDPTPLYPFTNTKHLKRGEITTESPNFLTIPSGALAPCSLRIISPEEVHISKMGFQITKLDTLSGLDILYQVETIKNGVPQKALVVSYLFIDQDEQLRNILGTLCTVPEEYFLKEAERLNFANLKLETGDLETTINGIVPHFHDSPQPAEFQASLEAEAGLFSAFAQNVVCAYLVSEQMKREQARLMSDFLSSLRENSTVYDYLNSPKKKI